MKPLTKKEIDAIYNTDLSIEDWYEQFEEGLRKELSEGKISWRALAGFQIMVWVYPVDADRPIECIVRKVGPEQIVLEQIDLDPGLGIKAVFMTLDIDRILKIGYDYCNQGIAVTIDIPLREEDITMTDVA